MNASISIKLTLKSVEADGSRCIYCNDPIYMHQSRIFARICERDVEWTDFSVCQSCVNDAIDELK